jgi:hypothetical protein
MFRKALTAAVILAFAANIVMAETEEGLKKEMQDLKAKQDKVRQDYLDGIKALNNSTMDQLSKLRKGDEAGRVKIMQDRKVKNQELREKFKKDADATRAEADQLRAKLKGWRESQEEQAKLKREKKQQETAQKVRDSKVGQ